MSVSQKLNIGQVASLLGLSLNEILEYVGKGLLKVMADSENEERYCFAMDDVIRFGEENLNLSFNKVREEMIIRGRAKTPPKKAVPVDKMPKSIEVSRKDLMQGGVIHFSKYQEKVEKLEQEKFQILHHYADYREQVGYRIGQLETQIKQKNVDLNDQKENQEVRKRKIHILKVKLKEARKELEETKAKLEELEQKRWWQNK